MTEGWPPRSIWTRVPSRRRLIVVQTPMTGSGPSMASGTSRAIDRMFLPPKVSFPQLRPGLIVDKVQSQRGKSC